jgi:hypothetical protein
MPSPTIHHASLVHPSTHSPALLHLIRINISRPLIGTPFASPTLTDAHTSTEYVVDCVADTVDFAMGRTPSSSQRTRTAAHVHNTRLSAFTTFAASIIARAEVSTPVLLATLVYIDRAKPHLHIALEEWALERVFLGALMVASKVRPFFSGWQLYLN